MTLKCTMLFSVCRNMTYILHLVILTLYIHLPHLPLCTWLTLYCFVFADGLSLRRMWKMEGRGGVSPM